MRANLAQGKPACSNDYPPLPAPSTKSKCEMFWMLASRSLSAEEKKEFQEVSIIKVLSGVETNICYKKENWENKGWCQTGRFNTQWGVCSNSCEHVYSGNKKV